METLAHLQFGEVIHEPGQSGWLTLDAASGGLSRGGGVVPIGGSGPAEFLVQGEPHRSFRLSLPKQIFLGRGSKVTDLSAAPGTTATIGADGTRIVYVGGTLDLKSNMDAGPMTATFTISVDY